MKRTWKTACVFSTAMCLVVVTQAFGQATRQAGQDAAQQQRRQAGQQAGQKKICLASKLTEMTVKDKSNQNLGKIEDLVIDQQGQVQYLAISTQGQAGATSSPAARQQREGQQREGQQEARTPGARSAQQAGAGGKLTLVPFEAVEIHEGEVESQNYVSLNIDKDRLTQAPSFTKQQLTSQTGQAQWMSQVDQFFEREKSGAARPDLNQREGQQRQQQQQKQEKEEKQERNE